MSRIFATSAEVQPHRYC